VNALAHSETIVAIASPPGRGGVGVVRVSGKCAAGIALAITQKKLTSRVATFAVFKDPQGDTLDEGLALWFPGPHSYTGEDTLELQGHGSPMLLQALVEACIAVDASGRTRMARPGEFTQRAFLNGKLDLAQAEAVADVIDAGSKAAARAAVNALTGAFSAHIKTLQATLIRLRMFTEATLDFPEEEGVEFIQAENARGQAMEVRAALEAVLTQAEQGQLLHDGIRVVLVGAPNVGKSALLNRLAGDEMAIVTPIAGTTRDTVRARIALRGLPCEIIDTAGIRDTDDEVERIGIERTLQAVERASVVLLMSDANATKMAETAPQVLARLPAGVPTIFVRNKCDQLTKIPAAQNSQEIYVSALRGDRIEALIETITERVGYASAHEGAFTARARHVEALKRARVHIEAALGQLAFPALELFAEELRLAHHALGEIVGEFTADDLLGEIFGKFCIGK
jgi:tRNA modification GTPase